MRGQRLRPIDQLRIASLSLTQPQQHQYGQQLGIVEARRMPVDAQNGWRRRSVGQVHSGNYADGERQLRQNAEHIAECVGACVYVTRTGPADGCQ